ncbi:MAG: YigZ family protein, partial [Clostridia bacterium]|nr:YigZ family protein [Clostridia bacterium]
MAETYTTIAKVAEIEFVERKSVFYGYAAPVKTEEEALALVKERRALMPDATHHVFGYHMKGGILARYSDDG